MTKHKPEEGQVPVVELFRPTGPDEYLLVKKSGFKLWPPRLTGQPIFYPVTNEDYAIQISRDWNVRDYGVGYVFSFNVKAEFMSQFPIERVGGEGHTEWWVPAERLEELNQNIVGNIQLIHEFGKS